MLKLKLSFFLNFTLRFWKKTFFTHVFLCSLLSAKSVCENMILIVILNYAYWFSFWKLQKHFVHINCVCARVYLKLVEKLNLVWHKAKFEEVLRYLCALLFYSLRASLPWQSRLKILVYFGTPTMVVSELEICNSVSHKVGHIPVHPMCIHIYIYIYIYIYFLKSIGLPMNLKLAYKFLLFHVFLWNKKKLIYHFQIHLWIYSF